MTQRQEISEPHNAKPLPFLMDHLPDFYRKKAEKELNETPENRVELLKEMKEIIKTEEDLKDVEFNDDLLYQYLRHSKYKVKKAVSNLQRLVAFKRKHEFYIQPIPYEDITGLISEKLLTVLPMRSPGGCTIIYFRYSSWNPDELSPDVFIRLALMVFQQSLRDPMTQINGFIAIHDMKNVSIKTFRLYSPHYIHLMYQAFLACLPGRYKGLHIINQPIAFNFIWMMTKPILPEKLKKVIFFHSSPKELLEHLPRSVLPSKYGGDLKDYYMTDWILKASEDFGKCPMGGQANYY